MLFAGPGFKSIKPLNTAFEEKTWNFGGLVRAPSVIRSEFKFADARDKKEGLVWYL